MTSARALAKVIITEYEESSLSMALEVVRLVSEHREQAAARVTKAPAETATDRCSSKRIVSAVCAYYDVTERDLKGRSRRAHLIAPRATAWMLLKLRMGLSYAAIGDLFDRDHTTIIKVLQHFKPDALAPALEAIGKQFDEAALEAAE